jgi:uncharacterized protein YgiM (DUF1202 family)
MNKLFFAFVIFAVALTTSMAFAQDDTTPDVIEYIVTAEAANLRAGAGTGFDVVTTVNSGDSLLIYDEEPEVTGWLRACMESGYNGLKTEEINVPQSLSHRLER